MAYPGLAHEEHKYLGKEYCSGYTDTYGKWNTGFYCPQYGSKTAVFCCGTAVFKYCCTNQEPVDSSVLSTGVLLNGEDGDGVSSAIFVRVPIVFGVVCGIAAVVILLLAAACYFCSCCFAYKKRRDEPRHLHNIPPSLCRTSGSTTSNLLNLYTPATLTTNSLVTTPLDLDWTLGHSSTTPSVASTYQPPQLHPSLQYQFGNGLTSAMAPLSQRNSQSPSSYIYGISGGSTTPSVISCPSSGRFQSQASPAATALSTYHDFLSRSNSTLSSVRPSTGMGVMPPPHQVTPSESSLQRSALPPGNSTSIVNSYLASLQQQMQTLTQPHPETPSQLQPSDRTRHHSPPPPYFQAVPPNNTRIATNRNSINNNSRTRMATIQSVLGGNGVYSSGNEELGEYPLPPIRQEPNRILQGTGGGATTNGRSTVNNVRTGTGRGNGLLSQRELIELLLRLTYNPPSSSSSSISRSDSRAGSDSTSVTNRSISSSLKSNITASVTGSNEGIGSKNSSMTFTISEVDEDHSHRNSESERFKNPSAPKSLELALSKIGDDSGVSSSCSTAGSDASGVIGTIKAISRNISEEALKLKRQHAVDDEADANYRHRHHGGPLTTFKESNDSMGNKYHQQQLAAGHTVVNLVPADTVSTDLSGVDERMGNADESSCGEEEICTESSVLVPTCENSNLFQQNDGDAICSPSTTASNNRHVVSVSQMSLAMKPPSSSIQSK